MKTVLSFIAGILFLVAFIPYIVAIVRNQTKPAKASWIIWAILDTITLAGMYVEHTINGQIIGAVTGAWMVAILSLRYGTSGWTYLDKFCLVGAIGGIGLWQIFNNPVLGIMASASVVFIGAIPTFVSAWKDPSRENKIAWSIFFASCVCATLAIPSWTLANAAQPVVFLVIETVMMYILYIHARFVLK